MKLVVHSLLEMIVPRIFSLLVHVIKILICKIVIKLPIQRLLNQSDRVSHMRTSAPSLREMLLSIRNAPSYEQILSLCSAYLLTTG